MDLTSAMLRYRECARHVWNVYFQPMPEGWHEFINVNHELFSGLVLSQLGQPVDGTRKFEVGYWAEIAVIPGPSFRGLPAMHVRERPGQTNQWQEFTLDDPALEMRFIEFFDFASSNDLQDLKWVRARVVGPAGHALHGDDVLLATEHVTFEPSSARGATP